MLKKKKTKSKRKRQGRKKDRESWGPSIKEETVHGIITLGLFLLTLFLLLSAFGKAGVVGEYGYSFLKDLFGIGYFLLPLGFAALGISYFTSEERQISVLHVVFTIIFLLGGIGLTSILFTNHSGSIGHLVAEPLVVLFDLYLSVAILIVILIVSALMILDIPLKLTLPEFILKLFSKNKKDEEEEIEIEIPEEPEDLEEEPQKEGPIKKPTLGGVFSKKEPEDDLGISSNKALSLSDEYTPPPLSLLAKDKGKPGVGDIKANANIIKRTLLNFNIAVEMDEISIGPSVTRYALKPAEGVKLSRILGLQSELALALAAHPVRIEAPIPGTSLVGIEIPNTAKTTVGLASLLSSPEITSSQKPLMLALGKGISGSTHVTNLGKAPHLLIAGATGSGKSVTIHALINSLLFRNSPQNLKFIMIDPKRVELTLYNNIPHLLTPVITDAKKAILALKWTGKEMERRYDILQEHKVRDIESYHDTILSPAIEKAKKNKDTDPGDLPETMPYVVFIIDELNDIMQSYPKELEAGIVKLAQKSRAVGIHLILSTQRPSAEVITGLIKANIPSRIALQVSSQVESRIILDSRGAENLLGQGDLLFQSADMSKPQRIQSAFISEGEVKRVVDYLIDNAPDLPEEIELTEKSQSDAIFSASIGNESMDDEDDDDLYEDARETVMQAGKASTSYLQRKLKVGYARAARLMDMLEERGIVGPQEGSKPRDVITQSPEDGGSEGYNEDNN